jgi:hypothetical protein
MVVVHFLRSDGQTVHTAGPFPWIQAFDGSLQAGPDGNEIALYLGEIWAVADHDALAGHEVPRCVVHGSECLLRCEGDNSSDSTTHGPFDRVEFIDGSVYGQPGRRLLALFDERKHSWYTYDDQRLWMRLVIESSPLNASLEPLSAAVQ